jgi:hypothetical protein
LKVVDTAVINFFVQTFALITKIFAVECLNLFLITDNPPDDLITLL